MKQLKNIINEIVQEELLKIIVENELETAAQASNKSSENENNSTDNESEENIDMSGGGLEDLVDNIDNSGSASSTDELETSSAPEDGPTDGSEDTVDIEGTGFGSGSAFSGDGGGSSGGFDFDSDSDTDSDTKEDDTDDDNDGTPDALENENIDPVQAIVGIAKNLRTKTGDAQQILNSVKAAMQEKFNNHEDAVSVIQYLWETDDQVLQVVARKLILFIKGQ